MNNFNLDAFKTYYKIFVGFFCTAFLLGVLFTTSFLCKDCKTRKELCHIDIIENSSLKKQLIKTENLCIEKINEAVKIAIKNNQQKSNARFLRLEKTCNELDCMQCKKGK
jgi:hypothetical protein